MFERAAIIHPGIKDGRIDVGRILDAMLYYSHVELIADSRVITGLWFELGKDGMRTLLTHPSLHVQITPEMPVVMSNTHNGITTHAPVAMTSAGNDGKRINPSDTVGALHHLINNRVNTPISDVKSAIKGIPETRFAKLFSEIPAPADIFESLIKDNDSMKIFIEAYARKNKIEISFDNIKKLEIEIIRTKNGYFISENVDLSKILISNKSIEWKDILPTIMDYRYDLHLSQARSSDIISNDINSYIASRRIDLSINRAIKSQDNLSAFEQFSFEGARPFGSSFHKGTITLKDSLDLIDKTEKFRIWLNGLPPQADIIKEYHKAVTKDTILDKLPSRVSRFSIFTGGGVVLDLLGTGGLATLTGLGLSAFDSFVLDGLVKGWRPNTFVDTVKKATEAP